MRFAISMETYRVGVSLPSLEDGNKKPISETFYLFRIAEDGQRAENPIFQPVA
jgi:hypothetical protein